MYAKLNWCSVHVNSQTDKHYHDAQLKSYDPSTHAHGRDMHSARACMIGAIVCCTYVGEAHDIVQFFIAYDLIISPSFESGPSFSFFVSLCMISLSRALIYMQLSVHA